MFHGRRGGDGLHRALCGGRLLKGKLLAAAAAGLLFGLGLAVSRMVNPAKIIGFLDVAGDWDPSLAFVRGGALAVSFVACRLIHGRGRPILEPNFVRSGIGAIDRRLVGGSVVFGIGWGLVGFCPGPAISSLAKPGTVGTVLPGGAVRVRGADDAALPPGEIGEIYLWLDGFPDFTYHGKDESRRAIDWDGLVTVGDIGYVDREGYVFLCDRKNDMVISGGVNIYPAEIEAALIDMPRVRDCAELGIPDTEIGEQLCAYIEPEAGAQPDARQVRAHLGRHLANYKVPRVIEFQSPLPREDSGKIFKRKLRAPYWEGLGRTI